MTVNNGVGFPQACLQIWPPLAVNLFSLWVWELVKTGAISNCNYWLELSSSHAHWQRQGIYVKSYIGAEATHTWLCIMGWVFHRPACKYGHLWRSIFLGFGYESWYKWKLFEIVTIDWNLSSSHAHWQRQGIHVRSYIGKEATYTWLHNGVGFSKAHLQIWLSLVVNFLGLLVWELVQMGAIWIILEL